MSSSAQAELLLFGGEGHETFLGCLDCGRYNSGSICNKFGKGSKYASEGIFNKFGNFGSKHSVSSPWNKYSSSNSVPMLVNREGEFLGYFTINKNRHNAVSFAKTLAHLYETADGDLDMLRNLICNER